MFTPQLHILPPPQRRLWDELDQVPPEFVLYGGTAVALYLGHRQSVDFDFFGNQNFDPARLIERIPFMADATITQQQANTLSGIVDRGGPVKLSFFGDGNLQRLPQPLQDRLAKAAREVDLDRLPTLEIATVGPMRDADGGTGAVR